jgi:uncharacterized protein
VSAPSLLERLRAVAAVRAVAAEPAHDFLHVARVAESARTIAATEGANVEITVAAALLHELFNYPKDHPESARSGDVCAERAIDVLRAEGAPPSTIEPIAYAIRVHSFSRGVVPETLEAKVLQDADRLDAVGAVGIARCFATCATMRRPFYSPDDPFCVERPPDDKQWGIDHFYRKLLGIVDGMHTGSARAMAVDRTRFMREFLQQLAREIR